MKTLATFFLLILTFKSFSASTPEERKRLFEDPSKHFVNSHCRQILRLPFNLLKPMLEGPRLKYGVRTIFFWALPVTNKTRG